MILSENQQCAFFKKWRGGSCVGLLDRERRPFDRRSVRAPPEIMRQHAHRHGRRKEEGGGEAKRQRRNAGSGAEPADAPAYSKQRGAEDEGTIDGRAFRDVKAVIEDWRLQPARERVTRARNGDRASQNESEDRVEMAENVEKSAHAGGIEHAGQRQPEAEDHAAEERDGKLRNLPGDWFRHLFPPRDARGVHEGDRGDGGRHEGRDRDDRAPRQAREAADAMAAGAAGAKPGAEADEEAGQRQRAERGVDAHGRKGAKDSAIDDGPKDKAGDESEIAPEAGAGSAQRAGENAAPAMRPSSNR